MKKKITIEDLAGMVKRGFDAVDARFDAMDTRFDKMDGRVDKIDQRLVNIESEMAYVKARVTEIDRVLDEHTEMLEDHSKELHWIHRTIDTWTDPKSSQRFVTYKEFSGFESRLAALEKKAVKR